MRDDFEASFDEQLQAIQAEATENLASLRELPAGLSQPPEITPFCFNYPAPPTEDNPAAMLRGLIWDPDSQRRAAAIMTDYASTDGTRASLLNKADDDAQLAAARILGVLVCAEESAINVFNHECRRLDDQLLLSNQRALREIETEERVHNWLIHQARAYYPLPEDIDSVRRRTRRLFMRVASRDLATHFARLTGLDSGVCISLSALLGSGKVREIAGFARLLKHIRHDEASHVKKSRDHAISLGFDKNRFHDCYELTRTGMVDMLGPIATSFEALGVDPDRLFARLLRFRGAVELED